MYPYLLIFHSLFRWLVLFSLSFALFRGVRGWSGKSAFSKSDDRARNISSTIAQIQLTIGYLLYFNSPFIAYFRTHFHEAIRQFDFMFFGMIHITLMTISIILITVGASASKHQERDVRKFRVMTIFYAIALLIIFMAIPWPFSPLANRPFLRSF